MIQETRLALLVGGLMLAALTFDSLAVHYGLIALLGLEGLTPVRPTARLCQRSWSRRRGYWWVDMGEDTAQPALRRLLSAERAWRLTIVATLVGGLYFPDGALWYLPWFLAFAMLGAGVSRVCPIFTSFKLAGLR